MSTASLRFVEGQAARAGQDAIVPETRRNWKRMGVAPADSAARRSACSDQVIQFRGSIVDVSCCWRWR